MYDEFELDDVIVSEILDEDDDELSPGLGADEEDAEDEEVEAKDPLLADEELL
jgi:hypothetical protein